MEIFIAGKYRTLVVKLSGDLDHHSAGKLREKIDRELERTGAVNVAFDFGRVSFMDSSGIGIIMGRYRKIACFGGKVYAIHADRQIQRILAISGMNRVVEVLA